MTKSYSNIDDAEKLFEFFNQLYKNNDKHVEKLSKELENHLDGQDPELTTVTCCDSRVLQGDIWENHGIGREFAHEVIGNHVNTVSLNGEIVTSGSIDYIPEHSDTPTGIVIIGHTGCGAVTATYKTMNKILEDENSVQAPTDILTRHEEEGEFSIEDYTSETEGITTDIYLLLESGIDTAYEEIMSEDLTEQEEINRLVEYNVDNQVKFLLENSHYSDTDVLGAVYDMDGTYGDPGRLYLTNLNAETDIRKLKEQLSRYQDIEISRQDSSM